MRLVVAAIAASSLTVGVAAFDQPPASAPNVHVVRIDAIAVDAKGAAVADLKPADFELREDGVAKPLDGVELRRGTGPRMFAIFLDEYHVGKGAATDRVREALTRFVDEDLQPADLVVVMKPLDSLFAIRLTTDREEARRSIQTFEGRKGDYEPRNSYERNYIAGTPARIDAARNQVSLSALNALAIHLGSLGDGRKTLVVATEGVGKSDRRRGQEYMPTLDTVIRSANRSLVSVYPVDPSDPLPDDVATDPLRSLATETDGQAIDTDLNGGLKRAAAESASYYLLTYRSPHEEDGKFHGVEVKTKRAGVRLRARKGYWAPSPDDALRTAVLETLNNPKPARPIEPARHISPLIRPWFGLSRGQDGKTRITVVWEPAARVPGDRSRRDASRIVLTVLAKDGTTLFQGPLLPTGPAAMEEQGVTPSRAVFDAAPGSLRLRMSVEDAAAQVLDSDVRDLAVPDFRRDIAIGTPAFLRARNAREFRLLDDAAAVPVASREFSRTERLLIRFPAYGPAGAMPTLSARLLSRQGQSMRVLDVAPAAAPGGPNEIDLPLAGLAAGEYLIEVTATSPGGEAKDRIGFRVTS
jgi:VWFA-related protein